MFFWVIGHATRVEKGETRSAQATTEVGNAVPATATEIKVKCNAQSKFEVLDLAVEYQIFTSAAPNPVTS